MALITLEELGKHLDTTLTSGGRASAIVSGVNEFVENYIGRLYGTAEGGKEVTEVHDYAPVVFLNNLDIQSVTELKVFGKVRAEGKYTLDKTTGRLVLARSWNDTPSLVQTDITHMNAVEVKYKAGVTDVPADLKLATLQFAADMFNKNDTADGAGLSSASVGGLSLSFANAQSGTKNTDGSTSIADYVAVFNLYKRRRIG